MKKMINFACCILFVLVLSACGNKQQLDNNTNNNQNTNNNENNVEAPAKNTDELISSMKKVETKIVNSNVIEFSDKTKVEEGEKIAVWVYSEPKFLGYFEVTISNGKKVIEGLEEALDKLSIESGNHNIALVTEKGENIGYVDIYVHEDGNMVEKDEAKIIKEEIKEEEIKFSTVKQNESNLASGQNKVIQEGKNGLKKVYYNVTYDGDGKEISRKKIKEEIITKATDKIVQVGKSDFNLNSAMITAYSVGFACLENQIINEGDYSYCNDDPSIGSMSYELIQINNVNYVYEINEKKLSKPLKLTKSGNIDKGNYNGKTYYFDSRAGSGEREALTEEICIKYNLSCGTW